LEGRRRSERDRGDRHAAAGAATKVLSSGDPAGLHGCFSFNACEGAGLEQVGPRSEGVQAGRDLSRAEAAMSVSHRRMEMGRRSCPSLGSAGGRSLVLALAIWLVLAGTSLVLAEDAAASRRPRIYVYDLPESFRPQKNLEDM
jgi:hypothetical protein